MTPLIDFTNPFSILTALIVFGLVLLLGKETKKSIILAILLGIFLLIVVGHSIEYSLAPANAIELQNTIARSITIDFIFILLSFFSYLWVDDIETKTKKKKSIDNSLDWFWSKV